MHGREKGNVRLTVDNRQYAIDPAMRAQRRLAAVNSFRDLG
jgi:hypothetical protein